MTKHVQEGVVCTNVHYLEKLLCTLRICSELDRVSPRVCDERVQLVYACLIMYTHTINGGIQ